MFVAAVVLCAQNAPPQQPPTQPPDKKTLEMKRDHPQQKTSDKEEIPPEEDATLSKDDISFNPLQSQRDVAIGDQYRKKGNYPAAASRYLRATLLNDGNAEAWRKLGIAREKMKDARAAREAYTKYLELDPTSKDAQEVKKALSKLKSPSGS